MVRSSLARPWAMILVFAFVLAACGGGSASTAPGTTAPTTAPPTSPPPTPVATSSASPAASLAETGRIDIPDQGFSITLADGWTRIPMDPATLDAFVKQLPPDSDMAKIMTGQAGQLAAAGIKLWAMDLRPDAIAAGFASNLNVIVQPGTGMDLQVLKAMAKGQLDNISSISNTAMSDVTLPAGDAVKATYDLHQALTNGSTIDVAGTQYYVAGPTNLYILSFSCGGSQVTACQSDTETMIKSLTLTP